MTTSYSKISNKEDLNTSVSDSSVARSAREPSNDGIVRNAKRSWSDTNVTYVTQNMKSMIVNTLPMKEEWEHIEIKAFLKSVSLVFLSDMENEGQERWELASFVCDNVGCKAKQEQVRLVVDNFSASRFQFLFLAKIILGLLTVLKIHFLK